MLKNILFFSFILLAFSYSQAQRYNYWLWVKQANDPPNGSQQWVHDVAVDSARGFVYAVGSFNGTLSGDFSSSAINSNGKDGFVAQFNLDGSLNWTVKVGRNSDDELYAVDIEKATGHVFVGGYGEGNIRIHATDGTTTADDYNGFLHGGKNSILISLNSSGGYRWGRIDGGYGDDITNDLVVNQNTGKVIYTGQFYNKMELSSGTRDLNPPGTNRNYVFIASRNTSNADCDWRGASEGNSNGQNATAIAYQNGPPNDYIYLLGEFSNEIGFYIETRPLLSWSTNYNISSISAGNNNGNDIFYCKLKANGASGGSPYIKTISSPGNDKGGDIMFYNNKLYIVGLVENGVSIDSSPANNSITGKSAFISKHIADGSLLTAEYPSNSSSNQHSIATALTHTNSGRIIAGGITSDNITFSGGATFTNSNPGTNDGFILTMDSSNLGYIGHNGVYGADREQVWGLTHYMDSIYVGGNMAQSANFDASISTTNPDNRNGFLGLLNPCKTSISTPYSSICQESHPFFISINGDNSGAFSSSSNGLFFDSNNGKVTPFSSSPGTYNIIYTVNNACRDTTTLTIVASSAPTYDYCPNDTILYTPLSSCDINLNYVTPTYIADNCGADTLTLTHGVPSGTTLSAGYNDSVVYILSDGYNTPARCKFSIQVLDTISPLFTNCPSNPISAPTSSSSCDTAYTLPVLTFSDNCSSTSDITFSQTSGISSGSPFPIGTNTVTFVIEDSSGNSSTCQYDIIVTDITPPVFTYCPNNSITIPASSTSCDTAYTLPVLTFSDNCTSTSDITFTQTSGISSGSPFPIGTNTVTFIIEDSSGNSSTCQYDIIVTDVTAPVFTNCPSSIDTFYVDNNSCNAVASTTIPDAFDNCEYRVFLDSGTVWGAPDTTGLHTRRYIAIDSAGNTDTCRVFYRILDTIAPNIICPNNITTDVDIWTCSAIVNYDTVTATDNCNLFSIVETSNTGLFTNSPFPLDTTIMTFTATDIHGNTSQCSFSVIVENHAENSISDSMPNGVCFDSDPIQLNDYISTTGGIWTASEGIYNDIFYPDSVNNLPATINLQYSIGSGACAVTDSHFIEVYNFVANAGPDDTLCGLSYSLNAVPNSVSGVNSMWIPLYNELYQPSNSLNTATVTVSGNGTYDFIWKLEKGQCLKTDTVTIVFYEPPIADAGSNFITEENEAQLDAYLPFGSGFWTIINSEGYIDDSTQNNTWVYDLNLGLNIFEWTVSNGTCPPSSDQVQVFYDYLRIPNAFSPNGDGVNDVFEIVGFDLHSDAVITILDRWGEVLFVSDDNTSYWNGTYKGKDVVEDTYFYILNINGKEYTGYIELRR